MLETLEIGALPPASRTGYWLVAAGIAMRRIEAGRARVAIDRAGRAARETGIPALIAEADRASAALEAPVARLVSQEGSRLARLADVEVLVASGALVVDACRSMVRAGGEVVSLAGRPVLFALARALGEAWPGDVSREALIGRVFGGREADESHRARLRVEIGRLRRVLRPLTGLQATTRGFVLTPGRSQAVAVLAPPVEGDHGDVLALLADGEAWSSASLALALGVSARTVQRALEALAGEGRVEAFGRGRSCRWMAPSVPGFPTSLLLPAPLALG